MRLAIVLASWFVLVGCGDERGPDEPDAGARCAPSSPPLPDGPLTDVVAYLPTDCAPGGLIDLPGRWFVRNPDLKFSYGYPRFEGSCAAGFRRSNWSDDFEAEGATFVTWSDGTRYLNRYQTSLAGFEQASGMAACVRADGTLAAAFLAFDSDDGEVITSLSGVRFAPKDTGASGLALVGSLGLRPDGSAMAASNLVVDGDVAYVVGPSGFDLIDVADPAAPRHLAHYTGAWNDVKVVRGGGRIVAFVSPRFNNAGARTLAIDVTNPDPNLPAIVELPEYSHSVFVRSDGARSLLYLATYTHEVPVYDVTDPFQPLRLGAAPVSGDGGVHDVFADGDLLYVNYTIGGLVALDVGAGLGSPVERGRVVTPYSHASWAATVGGRRLVIHGDEGMGPDGGALMRILDGDPASAGFLTELGRYRTRAEVGIHNILIDGSRAYVAYYQDGVRVVDLSDPTQPREVAHFNTWDEATAPGSAFEGAYGLRHRDGLIYVADSRQGLVILREAP